MTVDESADRLRHLIADAGLDPARPDPGVVWAAFRRYAGEPCGVRTSGWSFTAGDGRRAYFNFGRSFEGEECGEQVSAHFAAPPGVRLGLRAECSVGGGVESLPVWFAAVEALPAFKVGLGYAGWSFEVVVYGLW